MKDMENAPIDLYVSLGSCEYWREGGFNATGDLVVDDGISLNNTDRINWYKFKAHWDTGVFELEINLAKMAN